MNVLIQQFVMQDVLVQFMEKIFVHGGSGGGAVAVMLVLQLQ
jgi:hypothetical protein